MSYPRVTEILRPFTSYDSVPPIILEKAAARGTSVHAICASIASDDWVPDGAINEELLGYVNSFKAWKSAQVKDFVEIEKRYFDKNLEYSGQIDFLVTGNDDELYLVDIKTSSRPQKTYPVQMAAYENLLKVSGIFIKGAMLVYLDKKGEFPDINLLTDMQSEWDTFQHALGCFRYFNKGKYDGTRET